MFPCSQRGTTPESATPEPTTGGTPGGHGSGPLSGGPFRTRGPLRPSRARGDNREILGWPSPGAQVGSSRRSVVSFRPGVSRLSLPSVPSAVSFVGGVSHSPCAAHLPPPGVSETPSLPLPPRRRVPGPPCRVHCGLLSLNLTPPSTTPFPEFSLRRRDPWGPVCPVPL